MHVNGIPQAAVYGRVRAELERAGTPIEPLNTMIAAHALSLGLILVTDNGREFRRVSGLKLQNWAE
jgi:tRNA(fMet)-specific endonuclease VapC